MNTNDQMDPAMVSQLKDAIDANDFDQVKLLMTQSPELHRAELGYKGNGALTWAAECRGIHAIEKRVTIARWMIENGSDLHQGGDGPLMRAALFDERIPMMEMLVELGANVNAIWDGHYPIICAPCETLEPRALQWLIAHGANMKVESRHGGCAQMLISTYARNAKKKHACLKVLEDNGFSFPNTPQLAVHRGRIDLLEQCLEKDSQMLDRRFTEEQIYPRELAINPSDGLHVAPLDGATLLHLAIEYGDIETARWLIDHGADVNATSSIDSEGFGGHTPIFHTTVTLCVKTDRAAKLLLSKGADPTIRTTLRKQLKHMGDPEKERMFEFRDVTAIEFAQQFQEPSMANPAAIAAIQDHL